MFQFFRFQIKLLQFQEPFLFPITKVQNLNYQSRIFIENPEFYVKIQNRKYLVEVKPFRQTMEPKTQKRLTKRYINEVVTWSVNRAKWKAATEFCKDQNWEFMLITEKELKV